jgi:hypothetical protein
MKHFAGRIDHVLHDKTLILMHLPFQLFSKSVFDNDPASYPTAPLAFGVS